MQKMRFLLLVSLLFTTSLASAWVPPPIVTQTLESATIKDSVLYLKTTSRSFYKIILEPNTDLMVVIDPVQASRGTSLEIRGERLVGAEYGWVYLFGSNTVYVRNKATKLKWDNALSVVLKKQRRPIQKDVFPVFAK